MKYFLASIITIFCNFIFAQKASIFPLQSQTQKNLPAQVFWQFLDTLDLPFFEDFITTSGYTNPSRWADNQTWINNNLCKNQPNVNVATFDHLNTKGKPYSDLSKGTSSYADSLTSQPINLLNYTVFPNKINYKIADSIYLSFFVQRQGNGDAPEPEDSLKLFFKNSTKNWVRIWAIGGGSDDQFKQYLIPIKNANYLFEDFQFRFVNFTKNTGNLNHFHVDYVRMDKNRKYTDTLIDDLGITSAQGSLIGGYFQVPYSHFKATPSQQMDTFVVNLKNLDKSAGIQTRFQLEVRNNYNSLVSTFSNVVAKNIFGEKDASFTYNKFRMDTFSGFAPCINVKYIIKPVAKDLTASKYNALGNNNEYSKKYCFAPWYAYDDGSAEGGIGLDYQSYPPNLPAQFAMKFTNLKTDTLRGVSMYFNRSLDDVAFRSFQLRVWSEISPTGQAATKDVLLHAKQIEKPLYRDSMNLFANIIFDTIFIIPKGDFYVGWKQNQSFILNVGYDNNGKSGTDMNNRIFTHFNNTWEYAGVSGTPMIRPIFGSKTDIKYTTKKTTNLPVSLYPNPTQNKLYIQSQLGIQSISIINTLGNEIYKTTTEKMIDIHHYTNGMYVAKITLKNGSVFVIKWIKN